MGDVDDWPMVRPPDWTNEQREHVRQCIVGGARCTHDSFNNREDNKKPGDIEVEILRSIIKRTVSPMWWARLSYPDDDRYWTPQEQEVLLGVFGRKP